MLLVRKMSIKVEKMIDCDGLINFIRVIENCKTREEERMIVRAKLKKIRNKTTAVYP